MKKILFVVAALATMSVSSFGALLSGTCGTNLYNSAGTLVGGTNGGNTATLSCVGFNVAGATLNSVTLIYGVDYSLSNPFSTAAISVTVNFNPAPNATFTNDPVDVTRTGTGQAANPLSGNTATALAGLLGGSTFTPFTVTLAPNAQTIVGSPDGFSASVFYQYDYSFASTGVPEPSSMILMGSALLGVVGLMRRRR